MNERTTERINECSGLIAETRSKESALDPWWVPVSAVGKFPLLKAPAVFWAGWYVVGFDACRRTEKQ